MKRTAIVIGAALLALTLAGTAIAADQAATGTTKAAAATAAALSTGEVKHIVKGAGKITLKHGPLANLDMPAMTMVFRVRNPALLEQVKHGDKVAFVAENVNGALTVTRLEAAR
jgi:Cu/Ag efflux protein CusF